MKKVLFIAPKYSTTDNNPYLTNDLVSELANRNCVVTVVAFGDSSVSRSNENIFEHIIEIKSELKVLKYLFLWPRLFITLMMQFLKGTRFDQIVMFAPLCVMWPAVILVKLFQAAKKTAIIFDIFPIHQVKIGALPWVAARPLKFVETCLLACFTEITAMGERNKDYIERYYSTHQRNCHVKVMNLWGRGGITEHKQKSNAEEVRVVFGGQIIKGREVELLIDLFEMLRGKGLLINFDIYSKGPDFEELKDIYSGRTWLRFKQQLPRKQYFAQLSTYDVGAIVTDRKADLPTFPSKIIDYVEAGLKTYCLVEKESELCTLVKDYSIVHINPFSFTEEEIDRSLRFFADRASLDINSQLQELSNLFSVKSAASRLLE